MHPTVMQWVANQRFRVSPNGWCDRDVLEVGSFDVNGTVRPMFHDARSYIGVDVVTGPGVDQVYDGMKLPFPGASFDVVVSTEMLEHCRWPWTTVAEMARVCRSGGLVLITARGWVVTRQWTETNGVEVGEVACFAYHNPPDRWRFSADAMRELAAYAHLDVEEVVQDSLVPGWFMAARAR